MRAFSYGLRGGKARNHFARMKTCHIYRFLPTKTITLELDAYEKLRIAKRGGESFTEVIRRAVIPDTAPTGNALREFYRRGGGKVSDEYLESVERTASHDPIPDDPWA